MEQPTRKPTHLEYFDYSTPGAYFVTICTQNRKCTLSYIQVPAVGDVIGWFKYQVTKEINLYCGTPGARFFQRSYHDHVIREEQDYLRIWNYIDGNPALWREDCFYTEDKRDVEGAVPYECEEYQ